MAEDQMYPAARYALLTKGTAKKFAVVVDVFGGPLSDLYEAPAGLTLLAHETAQMGWVQDPKTGDLSPPPEPPLSAGDLAEFKASRSAIIDARAEALRLTLITPGSGQAMEYQEAYAQAKAALAEPDGATPEAFPLLAVTIGVDIDPDTDKPAKNVIGVARAVKKAFESYVLAGAAIKAARIKGKAAIEAATDRDGVAAALDAIVWPTFE